MKTIVIFKKLKSYNRYFYFRLSSQNMTFVSLILRQNYYQFNYYLTLILAGTFQHFSEDATCEIQEIIIP